MTIDEIKALGEWAREAGVQSIATKELSMSFWAPFAKPQPAVDLTKILTAPMSEEELLGYNMPQDLKDPDDPDQPQASQR